MTTIGQPLATLDTPALWVDLDALDANIDTLAAHFAGAGVNWRPHTKGIKTPAIVHKLLAAGAIGATCAKLGEAEVLVASGVRDILIANQIVTATKIARLAALQRHADVKAAADNADTVTAIGAAATDAGVEVGLLVEIDTGMARAGVSPGEPTLALARQIHDTPGTRLAGLMTWEGHALGFDDEAEKRRAIETSIGLLMQSVELCRGAGLPVEIVSGGGSGTYAVTPFLPGMTEIQAGGAIFCDVTYQSWGVDLTPALFVRSTVTSRPTADRMICDAGFKTLPRDFGPPRPVGLAVESFVASAEHGIVKLAASNDKPRVGDAIDIQVGYGDATVFMHDQIVGMRGGRIEAIWPVLGRGKLT